MFAMPSAQLIQVYTSSCITSLLRHFRHRMLYGDPSAEICLVVAAAIAVILLAVLLPFLSVPIGP